MLLAGFYQGKAKTKIIWKFLDIIQKAILVEHNDYEYKSIKNP